MTMNSLRLSVVINKPRQEIFDYVLDPKNTSKWISFIDEEATNEWPPKLGTIYKNGWGELELTEYRDGESFVMSSLTKPYHVRYALKELGRNQTEFEYYEWCDKGELDEPFGREHLEKLKTILENS